MIGDGSWVKDPIVGNRSWVMAKAHFCASLQLSFIWSMLVIPATLSSRHSGEGKNTRKTPILAPLIRYPSPITYLLQPFFLKEPEHQDAQY